MSQPQVTSSAAGAIAQGEKKRKRRPRAPSSYAFTIQEFCSAFRLSRSQFYKLKARGEGPDMARAGDRTVFISAEAAQRWRKQREKAARA
jgi:hypothetical protein